MFFDDVIVVNEPFSRWRNGVAGTKGFDENAICAFEFACVVLEASQELGAAFSCDGFVFGGERLCELLETFDTEELRLKRFFVSKAGRLADE